MKPDLEDIKGPLYNRFEWSWVGRVKDSFGADLPEISGGVIADLGCAGGEGTHELSLIYPSSRIMGVDLSEECVKKARQKYGNDRVQFVQGNGYWPHTLFPPDSCDAVFMMNTLTVQSVLNRLTDDDLKDISGRIKGIMKQPKSWLLFAYMAEGGGDYQVFEMRSGQIFFSGPSIAKIASDAKEAVRRIVRLVENR